MILVSVLSTGNKGRRTQISNATRSSPRKVQPEKMPLDGTLTSNVAPVVNEEMTESSNPIRTSPTNVQQVCRSLEDKMKGTLFHIYIYIPEDEEANIRLLLKTRDRLNDVMKGIDAN